MECEIDSPPLRQMAGWNFGYVDTQARVLRIDVLYVLPISYAQ